MGLVREALGGIGICRNGRVEVLLVAVGIVVGVGSRLTSQIWAKPPPQNLDNPAHQAYISENKK